LGDIAAGIASDIPLPENWIMPVVATVAWTLFFIIMALWRFSREEL
jgi:hypothetical protein